MNESECRVLLEEALAAGGRREYEHAVDLLLRVTSRCDTLPQAFLYLGRSYHALGRYGMAVQALRYFVKERPDSSAGFFFLGRSYMCLDMYHDASVCLEHAVKLDPDNPLPRSLLGLAYLKLRRPERAVECLGRAVELDPENAAVYTGYINALLVDAVRRFHAGDLDMSGQIFRFILSAGYKGILPHLHLGFIEREFGNLEEAEKHYSIALSYDGSDPVLRFQYATLLFAMGKTDRAVEELAGLDIVDDVRSFSFRSEHINRIVAIQRYRQERHPEAIYFAKEVIKHSGADADMHIIIGDSYRILGSFEKAENHFHRAIEIDRDRIENRYGLAMTFWQQERWEDASAVLDDIERMDPGNAIAGYYSALCACKLGYPPEETIPLIQERIRKDGPDAHLFTALGEEYIRGGLADLSVKWFTKALTLIENHRPALSGLIKVYREQDNRAKTKKSYLSYLKAYEDDRDIRMDFIHFLIDQADFKEAARQIERHALAEHAPGIERMLAFCYRETGRYAEAALIYQRLLGADPKNEPILRSLVFCLERSGNADTAVRLLEKAVGFLTPSPNLLLITGVILFRRGDMERAMRYFKQVTDLVPRDWRAYENIGRIYETQGLTEYADKNFAKSQVYKSAVK